jgi:5-methylcytosine-specific restriction endonuclease McrA
MDWRINPYTPSGMSKWRWVCGNLYRKLLFALGLHWKQRSVTLDWYRFTRLVRSKMMEDAVRWDTILRREPCVYCQKYFPFEQMSIEHVVPKSHGGPDTSVNKVGCCKTCNQKRGSRPLLHFLLGRRASAGGHLPGFKKADRNHTLGLQARRRTEKAQPLTATLGENLNWKAHYITEQDQKNRKTTDLDLRSKMRSSNSTKATADSSSTTFPSTA